MKKTALFLCLYFAIYHFGFSQTWTGNLSNDWNNPGNWTPGAVPGTGSDVTIDNAIAPNQPVLPSNIIIRDLFVSAGSLNLNGFELNVRDINLTGGNIINGTIETSRNIAQIQNMVFNGNMTIIKNGGVNNDLTGGNIFNGPTIITNLNNSRLRFASTNGDTFNSTVVFNKNGTGSLEIAYNGINIFEEEVTINNTVANNQLNIGQGGGTSTLSNGGLITTDFNIGILIINNLTQLNPVPNGVFNPTTFTVSNSTFLGDISATTTGVLTLAGSNTFASNNQFISGTQLAIPDGGNTFNSISGTTTITRNGSFAVVWGPGNSFGTLILTDNATNNLTWQGNNTFNGNVLITNNSDNIFRLSNTAGDVFGGTVHFINNGTSTMDIAFNGNSTFADQITIDNNGAGNIRFGGTAAQTGTSVQNNGGINTNDLTNGTLSIRRFTQLDNIVNGPFNPLNFEVENSSFIGDFSVTTIGQTTFTGNSSFGGNNSFTANGNIAMVVGGNTFSNPGNTTTIARNGGGNITWGGGNSTGNFILENNTPGNLVWQGGNTFNGDVSINNNSNNLLRLANTNGDEYLGTSVFNNNGTNAMDIGRSGTNIYRDQITINNTNAGGTVSFGLNGGTNELQNGALTTTNFSAGILNIRNFDQLANIANSPFEPNTFTVGNSSFEGDFTVTTSGDMNLQADVRFASNNSFISNGQLTLGGNSEFSTNGATSSYFEKNGGGNVTWNGGNTFGTVEFVKNTANYIRMTNNGIGDTFTSTSVFSNNNSGEFDIARNGTNTFADQIEINNTNPDGSIRFGVGGGNSTQANGGLITSNFSIGNELNIRNFTQLSSDPNGTFAVTTFTANSVSLLGDFGVTNLGTGNLSIQNGSSFAGNNSFISEGGIVMTGGNSFSTTPGTTTNFTKNGANNNDWQGGNTFGNVVVTNNGTGRLRMSNTTPLNDAFIGNATFNQNGSGELDPVRNGTSSFFGNISTLGSSNAITFGLGSGEVNIVGNTLQQLLGDVGNSPTIRRLNMNTSGNLDVLVPFTLGVNMTLNNGVILNDENLITFIHNSSVTGGSNASHVDGRIRKIGNGAFTYPFGNGGFYAPLTTSGFGGGGSTAFHFTGRFFHTNPDLVPYDRNSKEATIGVVNECEYWEFERTNGTSNPSVTLSWSDDRTCPIVDFTEFIVVQWNGSEWIDLGQDGLAGDETSGTVRNQAAVSNWSPGIFSLGQSFRILPIELLSFSATATSNKQIKVSWATVSEKDNAFFTIMKSLNGQDWFPIGIVEGAGNSDIILNYEFIDENAVFGRQFYRLTQTDFDGTSETFKVVGVTLGETREKLAVKVYPNPTQGKISILSENQNLENAILSLYDAQGSLIISLPNQSGRLFEIDLSGLKKGIYLMKIYSNYQVETKKIVLH